MTEEQQNTKTAFEQVKFDIKDIRKDITTIQQTKTVGLNKPLTGGSLLGPLSIDLATSDNLLVEMTLAGNVTLTLVNPTPGKSLVIIVTQGGAGSFTVNLPNTCKLPGSTPIDWNTAPGTVTALSLLVVSPTYIITTFLKM